MRTRDQIGLARAMLRAAVLKRYRRRMRARRIRPLLTRFTFQVDFSSLRRIERQVRLAAARIRRAAMFRTYQAAMPGWTS